jgi:hypothetical protein
MIERAQTTATLARITDEGLFERLATAILREANPLYAALTHPGVNAEGKTIPGPLDGIAFVPAVEPPHLIAVHHTTTGRENLRRKWLEGWSFAGDDSSRASGTGDLPKTAAIVAEERRRTPSLRATLVLTCNEEPREDLVRDIHAVALSCRISVDLWSNSRLAHFLDTNPQGQWLRRQYLGVAEERLSRSLLKELSLKSLELHRPPDLPAAWIERQLDHTLASLDQQPVTFVVAAPGFGKSVAC